jgi:hypothetical protein
VKRFFDDEGRAASFRAYPERRSVLNCYGSCRGFNGCLD